MNTWTEISCQLANQRNYLDLLYSVYPTIPEYCREIEQNKWDLIETSFKNRDNCALIGNLLDLELFPIKDSYVAYLRHDKSALSRNPETVNRLAGRIYEMGIEKLYERCSEPKETNRQIGPLFKNWIGRGVLGVPIFNSVECFKKFNGNSILNASDSVMKTFAQSEIGYERNKGLDLLAKFNGKYVIGEAKFLTDFGGHQNAQFEDAILTIDTNCDAIKIAILDGVLYIKNKGKLYNYISQNNHNIILSALMLREFLFQV